MNWMIFNWTRKEQVYALFARFLSRENQVKFALKKYGDPGIREIIQTEAAELGPHLTKTAERYWEAHKELIHICLVIKDEETLKEAFDLMETMLDNQAFNHYLFSVSALIHHHHPTFMKIKYEFEGALINNE